MSERDFRTLGRYEIRSEIGRGTTASVYLAWDPLAARDVAIKYIHREVLHDRTRGKLYRALLLNEASLANKLVHQHIVRIHDAVIGDDEAYLVMDYLSGGTLDRHTEPDQLLPVERVVELMFKCTRALDYAHQHGITHRDIKPANILLTEDGDIKISDFGAALFTANQTTQVEGVGSPSYMSPQQVREMPLNHQTDIYSLGVVLYQLLSGHLPFEASNNYSLIYQITHVDAPPPSIYRDGIPASLDAIVARAMQKDLDRRYASWAEFAHDLAQAFRNRQLSERAEKDDSAAMLKQLRKLAFFNDFTDLELWEVARSAHAEHVGAGTLLMKDGEIGEKFHVLVQGELRVSKRGKILSLLSPGECCGEMCLVSKDHRVRANDVTATTDCQLVTINGDAIRRASEICRMRFYEGFLQVLSSRLAAANARLAGAD